MSSGWNQPSSSNYRSPPRDNPYNNGFWEPFRQAFGHHDNMSHHRNMEIPPPPQQLPNNNYDMVVHSLSPQYEKNNQRDMEEDEEDMEEEDPRQKMTRSEVEAFRWAVSNYHFEDVKQCLEIIDNSRLLKICSESPFPLHGIIRNNHPDRMGKGERIVRMVISRINQSILGVKDNHGNVLIDRAIYANMESLVTFLLDLGTPLSNTNNKNMETIDAVVIMLNPRILGMCMMKGVTSHQMDTRYQELHHYHRSRDYFERSAHHKKIAMATTLASCQEKRDQFFKFHSQSIPIADISQIISVPIGRNPNFGRQHVVFFRFPQLGFIGDCYVEHFRLVIVPADFKMNARILMATEHGIRLSTNPKLNDRKCRLIDGEGVYDCSQVVRSQMMNPLKWYEDEMNPRNVFRLKVHFSDHETCDFALCAIVRLRKAQIAQEIRYPSPDRSSTRSPEYEDFHDHQNQRDRWSPALRYHQNQQNRQRPSTPEYEDPADNHYHHHHQSPAHRYPNQQDRQSPATPEYEDTADAHYYQNQRDYQSSAPRYQRNQQDRRQTPATPEYGDSDDSHNHQDEQNRRRPADNHYHQDQQDHQSPAHRYHQNQRNRPSPANRYPNQQNRQRPATPEYEDPADNHYHQDQRNHQSPEYEEPEDSRRHQNERIYRSPADTRYHQNQQDRRQQPATPEYGDSNDSDGYPNSRDRQSPATPDYEDPADNHYHQDQRNHQSPAPRYHQDQQHRRSPAEAHRNPSQQDLEQPATPEHEEPDDTHYHQYHQNRQSLVNHYHQDQQDHRSPAPRYHHNQQDHQNPADTHRNPNQQDHEQPATPESKEPVAPNPIKRGRGRPPGRVQHPSQVRPTDPALARYQNQRDRRRNPADTNNQQDQRDHQSPTPHDHQNQQDRLSPVAPHRNPSTRVRRPPRRYQHPSPVRPIPGDESEATETEEEMCAGPLHPPKKKKPKKVPVSVTKDQQVENRKLRAERRSRRSNEASCSTD